MSTAVPAVAAAPAIDRDGVDLDRPGLDDDVAERDDPGRRNTEGALPGLHRGSVAEEKCSLAVIPLEAKGDEVLLQLGDVRARRSPRGRGRGTW